MKRGPRIVTEQQQLLTFTRRAMVLGGAQFAMGTVLAGRMAWLSVAENERYKLMAEDNRVQLILIPPRRGWLIDRQGKPMAINRTDFRVDIIPDQLQDEERVLAELGRLLALPEEEMQRIRDDLKDAAGFRPVPVAEKIDYERFAAVSVRQSELPGVAPARGYTRYYPAGAAVGHLIGYVGVASAKDYEKNKDPLLITPGFKIGKEGLEKTMEPVLRGKPGAKRSEVTARGKIVRDLDTRSDEPGGTLRLSVDAGLQAYAARRIGTNSGSVVVMDCHTGDLLCMASMPSYDPNSFSDGIGHSEYAMLRANDHLPLLNKTLQGLYPPGSTVKPAVALALLRAGITPEQSVVCTGRYRLGNRYFHCHKRGGHGHVDMRRAIHQSCDVYFYHYSQQIGIDAIATMMRNLGLGAEFPLPVASQRYGTVPDTAWKQRRFKTAWATYDTVNATIGQGYMLSNPLQLAVMSARIASGRMLMPRLLARSPLKAGEPLDIDPEHLEFIRSAMSDVVNGPGTAGRSRLPLADVQMAGKTGTAQVRNITAAERARGGKFGGEGVPWKYRDHALFIGFAPVENPRYAAAVVIEHGIGGSAVAAPIARDVLTYLYDPAKALATLDKMEEGWGGNIETRMAREAAEWGNRDKPAPASAEAAAPPATTASAPAANAAAPAGRAAASAGNAAAAGNEPLETD
ncbi:penicillin-binding protein 2 [Sphingomonas laterariae]|uniref:Penicillin-binding protein 2 n=1 Tax=Edaphosphingomonas laterariae TaxID=861865 RepID=A0A239EV07_9SPHN|nr:penicillin-binding protein 2 [Sphingomonas laterariae]SNS47883.1 penicillin-binding protein 2 [Sphingomonas laterariae]